MQNPLTIQHAFLPLSARLLQYEHHDYQKESATIDFENAFDTDIDFEGIIKNIAISVNLFNPKEVYKEASIYKKRVSSILKDLAPKKIDINYDFKKKAIIKKATSKEKQNSLLEQWRFELKTYQEYLMIILKITKGRVENTEFPVIKMINLPSGFPIQKVSKLFKPLLSTNETCLFLYYLMEEKLIPQFSKTSLGILAQHLFFRSDDNIRQTFSYIEDIKTKDNLTSLKYVFQTLIGRIDKDLK